MGLFASSQSAVQQPGVFLIELATPTVIDGVSNGFVGLVFQGEWGPVNQLFKPTSGGEMLRTYFPPGSPHNSTGYFATMRRKQVPWAMNRILGDDAGLYITQAPVITTHGAAGSTSYTYVVVANNAAGSTTASPPGIVTTGNATLDTSNWNIITFPTVTGATSFDVYRTASGGTPSSTGKIASAQTGATYADKGDSATGSLPTSNTSGWAPSLYNLLDSAGVAVQQLVAKYPGTLGNNITATVGAATSGATDSYDLTVTLSDANTGSTTEKYVNLKTFSTIVKPDLSSSNLLLSANLIGTPSTRPANGTYTLTGAGAGDVIDATDYNNGFTNLATDSDIRFVCIDDCGDSIRSATNADLQAHVDATTDRMCALQGPPGNALAAVLSDVANYRDDRVIYCGSWVNVLDDSGTPQQSPFSTFIASAIANLEPQQSHAWYDDRVTFFYNGVNSFFNPLIINPLDDSTKNQCTQNGVCLPTKLVSGKFAALHDRTTNLAVNKRFAVTRRIKDYLALSIKAALPGFVNGPNTIDNWRAIKSTVEDFLQREFIKGRIVQNPATPNNPPFSTDMKSGNSPSSVAAGQFVLIIQATSPAPMENIFIELQVGPTVIVSVQ